MFKTILVQIDGGAGQASRLRAAAVLAEMHGAHLVGAGATGISLANYAVLNGGMAAPLSDRAFEALRDNVRIRLDAFIEQAQPVGFFLLKRAESVVGNKKPVGRFDRIVKFPARPPRCRTFGLAVPVYRQQAKRGLVR